MNKTTGLFLAALAAAYAGAGEEEASASPENVRSRQIQKFLNGRVAVRNKGRNIRSALHSHKARDGSEKHYFLMHADGPDSVDHGKSGTEYRMSCFAKTYKFQKGMASRALYSLRCEADGGAWGRKDQWVDVVARAIVPYNSLPWNRIRKGQHPYAHLTWKQVGGNKARRSSAQQYATYQRLKKEKAPERNYSGVRYQWKPRKPHCMNNFRRRLKRR